MAAEFKRYLPSDVSSDIHQIMAKAMFLRALPGGGTMTLSPAELHEAADCEFEYDLLDNGSLVFRRAVN